MDPSCFGFRLASWNANGIKSRIVEVRDFIDKHHPDVFLIQESHLGPGDNIHIPNYTVYRNDRPHTTNTRPRGGTAILLKSSLPHHHTPTPPMGTLTPPAGDPLAITSLYISSSVSYRHIHTDVEALFSLGNASIICGDFLLRFGRNPTAHDRTEQSQENLAVHARSERQESVEQHSEQNTQKGQSLSKQDLGGRTSSSRPKTTDPSGKCRKS
ncbi:putative RNA-directed DNA polymerase from transposon BS [Trichonephila clavipes]|nr:putative RNA-directed DNA polymerase from transposon BS [Trichonephila clavipes]